MQSSVWRFSCSRAPFALQTKPTGSTKDAP